MLHKNLLTTRNNSPLKLSSDQAQALPELWPEEFPFDANSDHIGIKNAGHWMNFDLSLSGASGGALVEAALHDIATTENRSRRRKKADLDTHRLLVEKLLANAFGVHFHRRPQRTAYSRKADAYSDKNLWPKWLSGEALARSAKLLSNAGWLNLINGVWGGYSSTFYLTDKALQAAESIEFDAGAIQYKIDRKNLVRLKDAKEKRAGSRKPKAPYVFYQPTEWTEELRDCLDQFNMFLSNHSIDLNLTNKQRVNLLSAMAKGSKKDRELGLKIVKPELYKTSVYRVFNDNTFDHGGRIFGGFWQTIPSAFRPFIIIDSKPTIELDYSGFALRSFYHLRGIEYTDDPYEIPEITNFCSEQGLPLDFYRSSLKDITQALINGGDSEFPERITTIERTFKQFGSRLTVRNLIEAKHHQIADVFGTLEGKKNQRLESDIALDIIHNLKSQDILALPIHDSFIVKAENEKELRIEMNKSYYERIGYQPMID